MKKNPADFTYTDFLVTGEEFHLENYRKGIFKTIPVPENLSQYYKSENYISHTDRQETLQEKIYQRVKKYMLNKKASWIEKEITTTKHLDYGCGTGDFVHVMNSRGWNSFGIEPDPDAKKLAEGKSANIHSSLETLKEKDFSVITLWHVLEHIPDYQNKLQQLIEKLKPGGILVIAVPNYNSYDAEYYKESWAAWDVPRHLWHFSRKGLKTEIESNFPLGLMKEKPLIFDSFYVSLLSEQHQKKPLPFLRALKTGMHSNLRAGSTGEYSSLAYFFQKY